MVYFFIFIKMSDTNAFYKQIFKSKGDDDKVKIISKSTKKRSKVPKTI